MELEFEDGTKPFRKWFSKLRDIDTKAHIRKRIRQAEEGNFGNYRHVGDGVFEFKIFKGPGYRIYFGIDGDTLIVIILGGDKSSQTRDIENARKLWQLYLESRRL
jgi:putative addiction module killer protein